MSEDRREDKTYSVIFSSLKHPIRRNILRLLMETPSTFSEIMNVLSVDSGHLSYHLENLGSLITRNEGKYTLSSIGVAAVNLMNGVKEYGDNMRMENKEVFKAFDEARRWSIFGGLCFLAIAVYSAFSMIPASILSVSILSHSRPVNIGDYGIPVILFYTVPPMFFAWLIKRYLVKPLEENHAPKSYWPTFLMVMGIPFGLIINFFVLAYANYKIRLAVKQTTSVLT
ncbi:winged helix-turn-helix domain-containing protein [Candidatus Bathyarchaeota archaeon]|nr:winged helix-turn-helix domain-containing protein [Candidatus Bathyarchaeota archaeon]